jgi:hypothetical protein
MTGSPPLIMTGSPPDGLAPVYAQYPIEVVAAEGVWLHTRDGRKVLDLYGGHAVASLGYGHKGWTKALADQAALMNFQTNAVPMEVRSRAAQKLLAFSRLPLDSVFWINSGAEATKTPSRWRSRCARPHARRRRGATFRTAACAFTTLAGAAKWFFLPRAPFDVSWIRRRDIGHRQSRHREHRRGHHRTGAGRGRLRHGPGISTALRKRCDDTGAAHFRRGAMRRGPLGRAVRGQLLRRDAGHDHHRQGAG